MPVTEITLRTPLERVHAIGPRRAAALATLGLTTVGKLIAHLPMRHERLEAEEPIAGIAPDQNVSVRGEITATRTVQRGRRPRFEAVLHDGTARLDLVWFNQAYLRGRIVPGMRLRVQGKARRFGPGIQIANPAFEILPEHGGPSPRGAGIRPVYPGSEDVPSRVIEESVAKVLPSVLNLVEDHLPESFLREHAMPTLSEAYRMMHAPQAEEEPPAGRRRLAYDELLLLQLGVHIKRAHLRGALRAPALRWSAAVDARIRARFPFQLTAAQDETIREIVRDLSEPTPANRLIQGDVGSGKTVVALYAMLMAVASGHQAALMAPTEILAEQHLASISAVLSGSKVRVGLLTAAVKGSARQGLLARLAGGKLDILVGTHALLTESVRFASLALAVVDEQHRFGVSQRARLRAKAGDEHSTPHIVVMTATPIPRSLALTLFGDLDISTIRGLPPGRRPIATRVVGSEKRAEVYEWARGRLGKGEQAFIVVPTIESGEARDVRSLHEELREGWLKGSTLAIIHARLPRESREEVMERFRRGEVAALVATTVIEVGVDIPNASVMIIEHAERFGLAQLHQLRGRVGRGRTNSACILIADPITPDAEERLRVIASVSDGFALSEKDMEIRGPGEVFGVRQSGLPPFQVADLARDVDLLSMARRDAAAWIARSPGLAGPAEGRLRRRLLSKYGGALSLGDVG